MAAFGAPWCGVRLPTPSGHERSCGPVNTPLAAFVSDLVRCDRATPFKALYEMYAAACRAAGSEPESRRAVGLALSKKFDRVKGGDAAYFARPRLAAVATAA